MPTDHSSRPDYTQATVCAHRYATSWDALAAYEKVVEAFKRHDGVGSLYRFGPRGSTDFTLVAVVVLASGESVFQTLADLPWQEGESVELEPPVIKHLVERTEHSAPSQSGMLHIRRDGEGHTISRRWEPGQTPRGNRASRRQRQRRHRPRR